MSAPAGEISDVEVIYEIRGCQQCSQFAIDVVRKIPQLIPGKKNGENIATRVFLPIRFDFSGMMKNKNEWKFDFPAGADLQSVPIKQTKEK